MDLQGRNLHIEMRGDDVALLQHELRQLGYEIEEDDRGYFGGGTQRAVEAFQSDRNLMATGEVDEETAALINATLQDVFSVGGYIRSTDGTPLDGVQVEVFYRGFRTDDISLGEPVATTPSGEYQIRYAVDILHRQGKERANLFIRVYAYDENTNLIEIANSEDSVLFNAEPEATIDLVVEPERYRGPAKYDRIRRDLSFKLREIPLTELTEEEIPYLSAETNLERQDVEVMVQAAKVAKTINDSYELEVKPEIFYALATQDIPITSLTDVVSQDRHFLRRTLETALDKNTIRDERETEVLIDDTLDKLLTVAVRDQLKVNMGEILRTSPRLAERRDRQEAFIRESLTYDGDLDSFWEHLSQQPEFAPEFPEETPLQDLQFTLELGELTKGYMPVVELLQEELRQDDNPLTLPHLANWNVQDWRKQVRRTGTPSSIPGEDEETRVKIMPICYFKP